MSTIPASDNAPASAASTVPVSAPPQDPVATLATDTNASAAEGEEAAMPTTSTSSTKESSPKPPSPPPPPSADGNSSDDRAVSAKPAKIAKTEVPDETSSTAPERSERYVTDDINLAIPKASIKRIMKLDPDTKQLSQDAIVLMSKATELFVDKLAKASHSMAVSNKRKTIKYEDIADARLSDKNMEFLDGVVPQI